MQTDTSQAARRRCSGIFQETRLMNQAGSIVMNPYNIMVVISVIFMFI